MQCPLCGDVFESSFDFFLHKEKCQGDAICVTLSLSGCINRAKEIAKSFAQIKKQYPHRVFQIVPIKYDDGNIEEVTIIG